MLRGICVNGGNGRSVSAVVLVMLAAVGAAFTTDPARAQVALPPSVEPGRPEQRFQQPPQIPQEPSGVIIIPPLPNLQTPPDADSKQISLRNITVVNAKSGKTLIYSKKDLELLYANLIGKENEKLSKLFAVANEITKKYGNDGYILSFAYIPPQRIEKNGDAIIKVVEGFVDKVEFDKTKIAGRSDLVNALIERIRLSVPLQSSDLEQSLLLLSDLPGLSVQSNIKASDKTQGASTLYIEVSQKPIDASVSVDNRGTRSLGKNQGVANVSFNSLFGLYERTNVTYARSPDWHEFSYLAVGQQHILNEFGTSLALNGSRSWSRPGDRLKVLEVESSGTTAGFAINQSIIRSRRQNLSFQGGFTYRNSTTDQLQQRSAEDHVRYLTFGLNYDFKDSFQGSNLAQIAVSHGLNVFNATRADDPMKSRLNGKPDFTKFNVDLVREQQLIQEVSLQARASGQWSADSLLAAQEFGIGGEPFGRAYDSSEITGDHGITGSIEARYTPELNIPHLNSLQFYGFYDIGAVFQRNPINKPKKESAASVGIGIRAGVFDYVSGSLELAQPLTRAVIEEQSRGNNGKAPRVFFRLTARY